MSAPQEGGCIKVFPIATALARAYNCLLLPGLGVTACLSPGDSQLATDDVESSYSVSLLLGRIDNTGDNTRDIHQIRVLSSRCACCLLCFAKRSSSVGLCTCIVREVVGETPVWELCTLKTNTRLATHQNTNKTLSDALIWVRKAAAGSSKQLQLANSNLWPHLFACFELHSQLSASCYSCKLLAARLKTKQEMTSHPLLRDITGPGRRKRSKGRRETERSAAEQLMSGKRKLSVFRSHTAAVAQTSQTLWCSLRPARQINGFNLSHLSTLSEAATNPLLLSQALPSAVLNQHIIVLCFWPTL